MIFTAGVKFRILSRDSSSMDKKVIELFAGVGGFRVGLNKVKCFDEEGKAKENGPFDFVWSNQWEPSTKKQHAFECYSLHFPDGDKNSNVDISQVDKKTIPDHDLLCGGFPCQDYSVARSLSKEKGIEGKKGVLWWQIDEILEAKKPSFILLENVDRLLKSPSKQRGRDFGIMLRCLSDKGYAIEWRVINAADYGHSQRRRRVFIFGFRESTKYYKRMKKLKPENVISEQGVFAKRFPISHVKGKDIKTIDFVEGYTDLVSVSDSFKAPFRNAGYMIRGKAYTCEAEPIKESPITLGQIAEQGADEQYYLTESQKEKFRYLRGSKKVKRVDKTTGFEYLYSEGSMSPFDSLDLPARTMLTSEGSTNRSTHIIEDPETKKLRLLTPVECERLNQFPDNWTDTGMTRGRRYFMMGNALVCGIIEKLGEEISSIIDEEK